jgi:hypothetical protein
VGGSPGLNDGMKISILEDLIAGMVAAGCNAGEYDNRRMYVLVQKQDSHTKLAETNQCNSPSSALAMPFSCFCR